MILAEVQNLLTIAILNEVKNLGVRGVVPRFVLPLADSSVTIR